MTLRVRPETDSDQAATRQLLLAAFPTAEEADLVEALRADGDSTIALVAEETRPTSDRLVGFIMLSRMDVQGDGRSYRAVGLGPLAVLPRCQQRGIGSMLVEEALREAGAAGEELVFVVGEPAYYGRFAFSTETAAPFASPYAGPFFMALTFETELPTAGTAAYSQAFAKLS